MKPKPTSPKSPGSLWFQGCLGDSQPPHLHQLLEGMPELDNSLLQVHKLNAPKMLGRSHSGGALIYIPPSLIKSKPTLEERLAMPELSIEGGSILRGRSSPTPRKTSCSSNIQRPLMEQIGEKRKLGCMEEEEEETHSEKRQLIDRIGGKWNKEPLRTRGGPGRDLRRC